jgi:uncharacterized integral membrane protein
MKNILKTYTERNNGRRVRIRSKGVWHILLHSLLYGLMFSIYMIVTISAVYFMRGRLRADNWPLIVLVCLGGGLVIALGMWVVNVNESWYEKKKALQSKRSL